LPAKPKTRPLIVRSAFDRFIHLIEPISDVEYVSLPDEGPPEVFTYITRRDDAVCFRVFDAEDSVIREYPSADIEFHISFLNGKRREDIEKPPGLDFVRKSNG
jgi:hypothetical protein